MLGGGGADGGNYPTIQTELFIFSNIVNKRVVIVVIAIHQAAGPELRTACYDVPEVRPGVRCPTGEARITPYVLKI